MLPRNEYNDVVYLILIKGVGSMAQICRNIVYNHM